MRISKSRRAELKALAEKATAGPWEVWDGCSWRRIGSATTDKPVIMPIKAISDGHPDLEATGDDLQFAAASRQALPDALADIEELEKERDDWRNAFDGELSGAADIRSKLGAQESETFHDFITRIADQRDVWESTSRQWENQAIQNAKALQMQMDNCAALHSKLADAVKALEKYARAPEIGGLATQTLAKLRAK